MVLPQSKSPDAFFKSTFAEPHTATRAPACTRGSAPSKKRSAGAVVHVLVVDEHSNAVVRHETKGSPAMPWNHGRRGGIRSLHPRKQGSTTLFVKEESRSRNGIGTNRGYDRTVVTLCQGHC